MSQLSKDGLTVRKSGSFYYEGTKNKRNYKIFSSAQNKKHVFTEYGEDASEEYSSLKDNPDIRSMLLQPYHKAHTQDIHYNGDMSALHRHRIVASSDVLLEISSIVLDDFKEQYEKLRNELTEKNSTRPIL